MTTLLLNPTPGFSECQQIDRWLAERQLAFSDAAFRFIDLDGDVDPAVPDIGVRDRKVSGHELYAAPLDGQPALPWIVRNAWRILRDDRDGAMPDRDDRIAFLSLALQAARLANEGQEDAAILTAVPELVRVARGIERRMSEADKTVAGRPMAHRDFAWRGRTLHATYLTVGNGFESGAAFRVMPRIDLLVAHDARMAPRRTAVMAKRTLDLTDLLQEAYDRLSAREPGCWDLIPVVRPGPSPMILPARQLAIESNIGHDPRAMFDLLETCAAG